MPSIRMDKTIFPFFKKKDNQGPTYAEVGESVFGNAGYSNMSLEISGDAVGYVEGCINLQNPDGSSKKDEELSWGRLALIDKADYNVLDGFSAKGHYDVAINGMQKVRVVVTSVGSEVTILGMMEA
jgi:hypothetical protein